MKILIIGDQHFGASNNNARLLKQSKDFYDNIVLNLIKNNNIDCIVDLGDTFDKRDTVNINVLNEVEKFAYSKINIPIYIIVGNHSLFYRNSDKLNNLLVLDDYKNITIIDKPTTIENFDLIPWISQDNLLQVNEFILNSKSKYCFGHFEFNGFNFDKTRIANVTEKISQTNFRKYGKVFSGHYHTRSEKENILYVGTPYQLTWIDCNDQKSVYILDTNTDEITQHNNNDELFIKVNFEKAKMLTEDEVRGKHIKVLYNKDNSKDEVVNLTNILNNYSPESLTMIMYNNDNIEKLLQEDSNNINEDIDILKTIENYTKINISDEDSYNEVINILNRSYKEILKDEV